MRRDETSGRAGREQTKGLSRSCTRTTRSLSQTSQGTQARENDKTRQLMLTGRVELEVISPGATAERSRAPLVPEAATCRCLDGPRISPGQTRPGKARFRGVPDHHRSLGTNP